MAEPGKNAVTQKEIIDALDWTLVEQHIRDLDTRDTCFMLYALCFMLYALCFN
jgi:hypothetical protein